LGCVVLELFNFSFCNPMIEPLPTETLVWLHQAAATGFAEPMVLRHVMQRVDALEASLLAEPIQRETLRSIFRSNSDHYRRLLNLEAAQQQQVDHLRGVTEMVPASESAPVATDDELFDLFHQSGPLDIVLRDIYNLGRQHGAAPPTLPPNYIDPEHKGQDLELLQTFYQACQAEGGTTDEIHLNGIRAVLAAHPAAPPQPDLRAG
jgi:hypothetical protein